MENRKKFEEAIEDFQNGYQPKDERIAVDRAMSDKVDEAMNQIRTADIYEYLNNDYDLADVKDETVREYLNDNYGVSLDEYDSIADAGLPVYETEDLTAEVKDFSEPASLKMNGGKELTLSVGTDVYGDPLVVGSIDGKEVGKSYDALTIDFDVADEEHIDVERVPVEYDYTDRDAASGRPYREPLKVSRLSGSIGLDADLGIEPKTFMEQNRDSLKKAGFDVDKARVQQQGKTAEHDSPDR